MSRRLIASGTDELAVVDQGKAVKVTGRAANVIRIVREFAEEINREDRGRLVFHFSGSSLVFERSFLHKAG